jgi:hypothetical protein
MDTLAGDSSDGGNGRADMLLYLLSGYSQHSQAHSFQHCIAGGIVFIARAMDVAVDLDNERRSVTVEVDDVPADHLLPPEVQPVEPLRAKLLP